MASKKLMKFRPPWAPNTEFEIPVDGLSENTIAELLSKGSSPDVPTAEPEQEFEEVEGEAPKTPQFVEGEGPADVAQRPPAAAPAKNAQVQSRIQKEDEEEVTRMMNEYNNMSAAEKKKKYGDGGPNMDEYYKTRQRDLEAKKLGAKNFAALNQKQKAAVMEHLQDADTKDLELGKMFNMGASRPIDVADEILSDPTKSEAISQTLGRIPGQVGGAIKDLGKSALSAVLPKFAQRIEQESQPQPQVPMAPQAPMAPPPMASQAPPVDTSTPILEPGQAPQTQQPPADDSAYLAEQEANSRRAELQRMAAEDQAKGRREQGRIKMEEAARLGEQQERMAAKSEQLKAAYQSTVDAMNDPSLKVNPDNFWQSRSTPQRIAAAIGVLLSGFGKGPNQAVEMLDRAVARDIQAQQANVASKRQGLQAKAQGQLQLMDMMRQQGLDEYSQIKLAHAAALDNVSKQLEAYQAQAKSEDQAAQFAEANAQIQQKRDKNILEARERATRITYMEAQTEEARADAFAKRAKATAERKAPPEARKAIQELQLQEKGLRTLLEQEALFDETRSGPLPQQANAAARALDFTGKSATRRYESTRVPTAYTIHRILEPGARGMTDKDLEATVEQVLPSATNPTGKFMFQKLRKSSVQGIMSQIKDAKNLGYDTSEIEARILPLVRKALEMDKEEE